jgi:hypothetical protein
MALIAAIRPPAEITLPLKRDYLSPNLLPTGRSLVRWPVMVVINFFPPFLHRPLVIIHAEDSRSRENA